MGKLGIKDLKKHTVIRDLHKLDLKFRKGYHLNVRHDAAVNVEYRRVYIQRRLRNLREVNGRLVPIRPEVFLDESYIYTNHTIEKSWLPKGGIVCKPGRGSMIVIFGAFIVWDDDSCGILRANFIEDFICNWPASGRAHLVKWNKKTLARPTQSSSDSDPWRTVNNIIRESDIVPQCHDYHGSFTADLFETILKRLCDRLTLTGHSGCDIHMDGASYHVRDSERPPCKSSKKCVIKNWIKDNNIHVPEFISIEKLTKAKLYEIVEEAKKEIESLPNSYKIAREHGSHRILKTPPYHCELQPIEMIWGVGKNIVGADAEGDDTEISLHRKLDTVFSQIPQDVFLSAWMKCIAKCQEYSCCEFFPVTVCYCFLQQRIPKMIVACLSSGILV
jgi:arsenate reductase-like glutaredoxin family protein